MGTLVRAAVLVAVLAGWQAAPTGGSEGFWLKVMAASGDKATVQPYVVPRMTVQVDAGIAKGVLGGCKQEVEERKFQDHTESVVVIKCDDGVVLEVKGLFLQ